MRRLLPALAALCLLAGCSQGLVGEVSDALGVDLTAGAVSVQENTHGGFHGDGETYVELTFEEAGGRNLAAALASTAGWNALPLSGELRAALEGSERGAALAQPQQGYWFFRDRHSQSTDPSDDGGLNDRYSWNFDAAVYDAERRVLYYYALDT